MFNLLCLLPWGIIGLLVQICALRDKVCYKVCESGCCSELQEYVRAVPVLFRFIKIMDKLGQILQTDTDIFANS